MRSRETSTSTERGALLGFEREQTWRSRENLIGGGVGGVSAAAGRKYREISSRRSGGSKRNDAAVSRDFSPGMNREISRCLKGRWREARGERTRPLPPPRAGWGKSREKWESERRERAWRDGKRSAGGGHVGGAELRRPPISLLNAQRAAQSALGSEFPPFLCPSTAATAGSALLIAATSAPRVP